MPAIVAICLALRLVAASISSNWLWGLDPFRDWGWPAGLALATLAALGFVPAVERGIERVLSSLGDRWRSAGRVGDVAVALAVGVTMFFLRDPVHFAGDFSLRVGSLASNLPPARMFPQAFPLDLLVNVSLARALMQAGLAPGTAMQAVGCAMAGAFMLAGLDFARAAGARGASLPAAAILLAGGGWVLHFAGYDKFGPLLVGWTLAAAGWARLARRGAGAWILAAGAVICLLSHRAGYLALPAAVVALALAWRDSPAQRRASVAAAGAVVGVVAAVMLARAWNLIRHVDVAVHLVPAGGPVRQLEWMLRASDALNALFFLAPLWPAGLLAAWATRASRGAGERSSRSALGPAAALALAAQVVFLVATRAGQGNARDWDVFTAAGLVFGLTTVFGFVRLWERGTGPVARAPAVTITLATAVALWGVTVSAPLALRRAEARLTAKPAWTDAQRAQAHDLLGFYAFNAGRYEEAARQFDRAIAVAPNPRFIYQKALALTRAGRLAAARDEAERAARLAPRNGDPWWILAAVARARGDSAGAAAYLDSARARGAMRPPTGL